MLNEDILDAVKKNLPAVAATELGKYIEQAEKDKNLLPQTKAELDSYKAKYSAIEKELAHYLALNLRKENIDEQERNLRVVLADAKATEAERRSKDIFDLVGVVFKNPVVRQNLSGIYPLPQVRDNYGNAIGPMSGSMSLSGETETEGTK